MFLSVNHGSCLQPAWSGRSLTESQHPCWHLELPTLLQHPVCLTVWCDQTPRSSHTPRHCMPDSPLAGIGPRLVV